MTLRREIGAGEASSIRAGRCSGNAARPLRPSSSRVSVASEGGRNSADFGRYVIRAILAVARDENSISRNAAPAFSARSQKQKAPM